MIFRNGVVASAAALALAAVMSFGPRAALAQEPVVGDAASNNPPLRLLMAKGNSFDGFFAQGNYCDYCDSGGCGCFFADSNGGTGSLKFDSKATVSMAWNLELDYAGSNQFDNGELGACWPASGTINTLTGANNLQMVYFDTSGWMCNTGLFNQTYTGSYFVLGGEAGYSTTSGAGAVSLSVYTEHNAPVLNSQLQLSGNISRSAAVPPQ